MTPDELKAKVDARVRKLADGAWYWDTRSDEIVARFQPILLAAFEALNRISILPSHTIYMGTESGQCSHCLAKRALALLEPK